MWLYACVPRPTKASWLPRSLTTITRQKTPTLLHRCVATVSHVPQVWLPNPRAASKLLADAVCGPRTLQEDVYEHVRSAVNAALRGASGTVVCCGAARSGKTHSLLNAHIGEWGVAPRAFNEVFTANAARFVPDRAGTLQITIALLCRERWHDLLRSDCGGCAVVQQGGVLDGHRWEEAQAPRDAMLLLQRASQARTQVRRTKEEVVSLFCGPPTPTPSHPDSCSPAKPSPAAG